MDPKGAGAKGWKEALESKAGGAEPGGKERGEGRGGTARGREVAFFFARSAAFAPFVAGVIFVAEAVLPPTPPPTTPTPPTADVDVMGSVVTRAEARGNFCGERDLEVLLPEEEDCKEVEALLVSLDNGDGND